ncbi:monocarboxylate transporter 12-like [Pollicipes pollicipes]|uniref:monocarboxylate transporter 12-like n=1 Tax=Pollicipes pollicipes TaxID=41117 RepID=UPI00188564E4|nr:monocarboxylate transporter 12-like [Pollicipes pollicipes]
MSLEQSMTYRGAMLNIHRYRLRASSCPDIYRNSMITILSEDEDEGCWSCVRDVLRVLQKMLDVSFFRLPAFTLFALSNFVLYMFYDVPYVYLADHAISGGATDEEASVLISVIGISNVVGVLLIGYVGDRPWASSTALYVACMLGCGVATLLLPSCPSYSALVAVSDLGAGASKLGQGASKLGQGASKLGQGCVDEAGAWVLIDFVAACVSAAHRLLIGYVGDRPWASSTALYVACMLGCGVATLLLPSCPSYSALVAASAVFGFCISANYTLAPTILVSLISIENFTNAYGILLLAQGLANLVGPPLCGMLRDLTGNYELTFHAAGTALVLSGLMLCLVQASRASRRVLQRISSSESAPQRI